MPLVSVIIPSYNHEKFVGECIQSVLNQTFSDFEIIITDDASTDRTVEIIEQFDDPRIKLFKHSTNQGVSITANNCILHASGQYIAWLSTDDAWYPEKLEVQVQYLDEHPEIGVVFGKVDWIDQTGDLIADDGFPYLNVFNVPNRNRFEWLKHFFLTGNCLSLPSSLIRRECFTEVGLFNPTYAKLLDLDLWIRICFKYDIAILDQKLIRNRWINDEDNASGNTIKNRIQVRFEYKHSLNHYLKIKTIEELVSIFPDARQYGEVSKDTILYILGRFAIANHLDFQMLWGLELIYELLQNENSAQILKNKCNFTHMDFIKLSTECDVFNLHSLEQLIEKGRTIDALIGHVEEGRQEIQRLTGYIAERDQEMQDLIAQLHTTEAEIDEIKNSRSWRYTEVFRRLQKLLHKQQHV